jgi:hypothetical protein
MAPPTDGAEALMDLQVAERFVELLGKTPE